MSRIDIHNLWKSYDSNVVLENLNLSIDHGDFVSIVGASGCGKTTFLRMILGEEQPSRGSIEIDGEALQPEPSSARGIVFQRYSVFPHLTVLGNVLLALEMSHAKYLCRSFGARRKEQVKRSQQMLERVGLTDAKDQYPSALSGGMQQRLALCQALIAAPKILLLDEPFGALDPGIRKDMQSLVRQLHRELGLTVIMITHDLAEGFQLGTRLLVFDKTRVDPQAPNLYGANITYDLRLNSLSTESTTQIDSQETQCSHDANTQALMVQRCCDEQLFLGFEMRTVEYEDTLPGGRHWSMLVRRGVNLTLSDVQGGGNLGMLLYNPGNPLERLNLPDSLKCQHTFKITAGHCLYSDMGRVFCSVVQDDVGWHDAASGTCNKALVERKWGTTTYQDLRNDVIRNGRDNFLIELAKYGLGKRDLAANMNWFSRVDVSTDGVMQLADDNSEPGAAVTLRFEMDTLVIMHSCPHPLRTAASYPRQPIKFHLSLAEPLTDDDVCLLSRDENRRGLINTQLYALGNGQMLKESQRNTASARHVAKVLAGDYWVYPVTAGEVLRITDLEGNQAVDTLFFNSEHPHERYSAFDTIREQGNLYLTTNSVLLSDEGNPMLEIVADTCGRHDTLGGACAGESNTVRYALEKKTMHSCRDSWLLAIADEYAHLGLTKRDLTHNINFFMNVPVTEQGGLTFEDGISDAGKYVELVAHMNVLLLISNCPQLNNPCNGYNPTPVEIAIWAS